MVEERRRAGGFPEIGPGKIYGLLHVIKCQSTNVLMYLAKN